MPAQFPGRNSRSSNKCSVSGIRSKFLFCFFLLLIVTIRVIYKLADYSKLLENVHKFGKPSQVIINLENTSRSYKFRSLEGDGDETIEKSPACPIPQLEPHPESIKQYLDERYEPNCDSKYPLLFNSSHEFTLIPVKDPDYFLKEGYETCCYRTVVRANSFIWQDEYESISSHCFPVSLTNATKLPVDHEFVAVYCKGAANEVGEVLVDIHAFVPLKPRRESDTNGEKERLNVLIFGLDGVSRMNFLRTMPLSHSFLMNDLGAVEMLGYNKVADNTFPNIIPMLTSKRPSELHCVGPIRGNFDGCPFIWKEYSKQGYYTMYAEDDPGICMFNFKRPGFNHQPTDYYLRPLLRVARYNFSPRECAGPRLSFQILLDYMKKFVERMAQNGRNYFHFIWSTALTHEFLDAPRLGDPHLLESMQWLKGEGYLNNTIFILMSDHGNRLAGIRSTIQGQLEDRLPLMYFVLPDSFKLKFEQAYRNLVHNSRHLITTFDMYKTLQDILHPESLGGITLFQRQTSLYQLGQSLPRGLSLFLKIPEFRTCDMAGIELNFCSCNFMKLANVMDPVVSQLAKIAVTHINSLLKGHQSQCANLKLKGVSMAQHTGSPEPSWQRWEREGYLINFETEPGGGQFEALVGRDRGEGKPWNVMGSVARTNLYGNQSHCVRESSLNLYCYCLDMIR